ncbi:MAG: 2-oxo acid dehydrogenase subunit E2 [Pirellulales bacterium]
MPHPITTPRLGWSMEEGVFGEWLKAPGEFVRAGDLLFLLEGEKAATEIESIDSGILCIPSDAPLPGTTVKVGDILGFLLAEGESAPTSIRALQITSQSEASQKQAEPVAPSIRPAAVRETESQNVPTVRPRAAGPAARRLARELGIDLNAVSTPDPTGRVLTEDIRRASDQRAIKGRASATTLSKVATPRARRRAKELGIDWTRLAGTGRNGRVRERDVLALATEPALSSSSAPMEILPTEPGRYVAASKLRRILAQRLAVGAHQAIPVTLNTKVQADQLIALRERFKTGSGEGIVPTFNDILIQLVAITLREVPELNACWVRNGIHTYHAVHIATAVDTPDGLLAPVVRDVDRLTLTELATQTRQLIAAARSGKLTQSQLSGGTFTVTNLGMLGIDSFTPILNMPQAGILGVGRIVEEPIVRDGQVVAGKTMSLSLTFDHRVIDGAPAARWLQRLCERIQSLFDC